MSSIGTASAKLLLFGEHAAVYGYPAIGIPLKWKITVSLTPATHTHWNADQKYMQQLNSLLPKLSKIFPELRSHAPFEIKIQSNTPIGVGFGSSGALCTALSRAIFLKLDLHTDLNNIWKRAHQLETHFHSHASGVDTGISVWEQEGYFLKNTEQLPSFHPLPKFHTPLLIGAFPRSSHTAHLVNTLKERLNHSPELMVHIKELGNITKRASTCLNDPLLFGALANEAHTHLASLGLSTPALDAFLETARSQGACGGKLSGAGGGGAYYLVCPNIETAEELIKHLSFPQPPLQRFT